MFAGERMHNLGKLPWTAIAKVVGVLTALAVVTSIYSDFRQFKSEIDQLDGIRIKDGRSQVLYLLGVPPRVLAEPEPIEVNGEEWRDAQIVYWVDDPPDPVNAMPQSTRIENYSTWQYDRTINNVDLTIDFDSQGRVTGVSCTALDAPPFACGPVAGIYNTDTEEEVLRIGRPTRESIDGVTKTMTYDDLGVFFQLNKGMVYRVGLTATGAKPQATVRRYFERLLPF